MVFETSAKTGHNVEDVFSIGGKEIFKQIKREEEIQMQEENKNNAIERNNQKRKGDRLNQKKDKDK